MTGDATCRFCALCEKTVYNLSEMTRDEALETLENNEGGLCVRVFKRHDGTVITADCPVGVSQRFRAGLRRAAALVFGAFTLTAFKGCNEEPEGRLMGEVCPPEEVQPEMGDVCPPKHEEAIMGKIAPRPRP